MGNDDTLYDGNSVGCDKFNLRNNESNHNDHCVDVLPISFTIEVDIGGCLIGI